MKGVFDFSLALQVLKAGGRVNRLSWGAGAWLAIEMKTVSTQFAEFVFTRTALDGFKDVYTLKPHDLLAEDWSAEHLTDLPKD